MHLSLFLHWRFARSAFPPTTREKGKNKSAGAEKKERPPERADLIEIFLDEVRSVRSTLMVLCSEPRKILNQHYKLGKTLARRPLGRPSERRGGSANSLVGWVGYETGLQKNFSGIITLEFVVCLRKIAIAKK